MRRAGGSHRHDPAGPPRRRRRGVPGQPGEVPATRGARATGRDAAGGRVVRLHGRRPAGWLAGWPVGWLAGWLADQRSRGAQRPAPPSRRAAERPRRRRRQGREAPSPPSGRPTEQEGVAHAPSPAGRAARVATGGVGKRGRGRSARAFRQTGVPPAVQRDYACSVTDRAHRPELPPTALACGASGSACAFLLRLPADPRSTRRSAAPSPSGTGPTRPTDGAHLHTGPLRQGKGRYARSMTGRPTGPAACRSTLRRDARSVAVRATSPCRRRQSRGGAPPARPSGFPRSAGPRHTRSVTIRPAPRQRPTSHPPRSVPAADGAS